MSLYIRLETSFWTCRKLLRLRSLIGNDALWVPPRLWCYAAENQPDGVFDGYSAEEIAMLIGYQGNAKDMLEAMLQAGFLDDSPLRIHKWLEHNSYHMVFAERAAKAAKVRWQKRTDRQESTGKERKGKEASIACLVPSISSSNATSIPPASNNGDEQWLEGLKQNPAYASLDVGMEYGRMSAWCEANHKQPTRRRFINWLNRADRPMAGPKLKNNGSQPMETSQSPSSLAYALGKQKESLEKQVQAARNKGYEDAMGLHFQSEPDRAAYLEVKRRLRELEIKLSNLT